MVSDSSASLSNGEIGYLIHAMKSKDDELLELLTSLNKFSNQRLALSVLRAYSAQKMQLILEFHFSFDELEYIAFHENLHNTPIHAAFLNWMVLGNLVDLIAILQENLASSKHKLTFQQSSEKVSNRG